MKSKASDSPKKTTSKDAKRGELKWDDAVAKVCQELGWKNQTRTEGETALIICPLPDDERFVGALFVFSEAEKRLAFFLSYRAKIAPKARKGFVEELARINFGMLGGCLEFDEESREVRCRDSLLMIDTKVELKLLQTLVAGALQIALDLHEEIKSFMQPGKD